MSKKNDEIVGTVVAKDVTLEGDLRWFTCKTGTGKDRYCVKVSGKAIVKDSSGEREVVLTAQAFEDWDGRLPSNLAAICGNAYTDPETGLHRSVKGALEGSVKVPADTVVSETQGNVTTFYQCDVSQGIARNGNPMPIKFGLYKGLPKSLNESMAEADKALEQLGY